MRVWGGLAQQARLADPRLARYQQYGRPFPREMALKEGEFKSTPDEWGRGAAVQGTVEGGPGFPRGHADLARGLHEAAALPRGQSERLGQERDGILPRRVRPVAFQVTDAPSADVGPLGKLLLREVGS
jgi:hypothetical protein